VTRPLHGLRVLEVATGIAGPYAGRLLALLGAEVVKVEPEGGDPARRLPVDDRPVIEPGPLFVHLNAGKDLRPAGTDMGGLLGWAHVVIDDGVRHQREGTDLDPDRLRAQGKVVASVTAWGFDADDRGRPSDELLVQAASGMAPATKEDGRPYRFPGWQSQYLAGGYAVAGALTALADPAGAGHHVDVCWVGAVLTGVEGGICAYFHTADAPPREPAAAGERDPQAGFQVGAFPAGVFRCADGHVIPGTVRPVDWTLQCGVYGRPDLLDDERFVGRKRWAHRDALRAELQPWYDAHTKRDIYALALDAGWALGMVMTAGDALDDPHLAARGFLGEAGGVARPWLARRAGASGSTRPEPATTAPSPDEPPRPPALEGLKVLELTWAWAGPFVGRWLGAQGADVVRVEAGRFPDGWRTRLRWRQAGVDIPPGADPDEFTYDAAALHNSLNRNKRSLSLDLTATEGRELFVDLLARTDLLVLNMSYSMLADRGLDADVDAAVARGLIVLNMPSLGATGPYRDMPGYGILIEGMGGFAARYGSRDEGARSTNTYYPDLVAGLHGTIAALAALADREATGAGQVIDLSQQEVTWLQFGEALVLGASEQREVNRLGDAEPHASPSGYYECAGKGWIAVVVRTDDEYAALVDAAAPHLDLLADLDRTARCARRDVLDAAVTSWTRSLPADELERRLVRSGVPAQRARSYRQAHDEVLEGWGLVERLTHPVTGDRPYLALPVRTDGRPWRSRRSAACFGEHTDAVLRDWVGVAPERLDRLRTAGVIGTTPPIRR
jgi:crotonobetainyl-CoA:carnitine CoA-transferase CaiB-like acyl-CoA transferase